MKELLLQYATYNAWANQRMADAISSLDEEQQHQTIKSSFGTLQATLQHLMFVENIWWQRQKLVDTPIPKADAAMPVKEIAAKLVASSQQWTEWLEKTSQPTLEHVFEYRNSKGEAFKQPVWQMLLHLFNHQTYHRGQLVLMLRHIGVQQIPSTDFILWSRGKR